jgi:hypothetical protein
MAALLADLDEAQPDERCRDLFPETIGSGIALSDCDVHIDVRQDGLRRRTGGRTALKVKLQRFAQVGQRFFSGLPLAGNVDLHALGDEEPAFLRDERRELHERSVPARDPLRHPLAQFRWSLTALLAVAACGARLDVKAADSDASAPGRNNAQHRNDAGDDLFAPCAPPASACPLDLFCFPHQIDGGYDRVCTVWCGLPRCTTGACETSLP